MSDTASLNPKDVTMNNGQFRITQNFIDDAARLYPNVNLAIVIKDCSDWIASLSKFGGNAGNTLIKFVEKRAELRSSPSSTTAHKKLLEGVRTTSPSGERSEYVTIINQMYRFSFCLVSEVKTTDELLHHVSQDQDLKHFDLSSMTLDLLKLFLKPIEKPDPADVCAFVAERCPHLLSEISGLVGVSQLAIDAVGHVSVANAEEAPAFVVVGGGSERAGRAGRAVGAGVGADGSAGVGGNFRTDGRGSVGGRVGAAQSVSAGDIEDACVVGEEVEGSVSSGTSEAGSDCKVEYTGMEQVAVSLMQQAQKTQKKKPKEKDDPAAIRHFEKVGNIARYDNWYGNSGMFRQVKAKKSQKVEILEDGSESTVIASRKIVKVYGDYKLTILTPIMGEVEQTLLLTLMSIARQQDADKKLVPCNQVQMLLPMGDNKNNLAATKMSAPVAVGITKLVDSMKRAQCASNFERVTDALLLLAMVVVRIENTVTKQWENTHLISSACGIGYNAIEVSLNYRLTEVLLATGQSGCGGYAAIKMDEHLSLSSGPARLLHTWLHVWGANKDLSSLHLDTLIKQIYGEVYPHRVDYYRQKKATMEALQEIANLKSFEKHKMPLGICKTK